MNIFYLKSAGIINVAFKAIKIIIFRKILKHDFSINIGKNRFKCITWDTTAFGKYKVASGVYFVLITTEDALETKIKKIMIIR